MSSEAGHFGEPASLEALERAAVKLRERNIEVSVVSDAPQARDAVLQRLPAGAEVHAGKSKTLQDIGLTPMLAEGGTYNYLRNIYLKMDRSTQMREIRKLISAPDFMLGSVSAVTEDGILVAASATASQLGPYASGAGKVILVVGSQKIVSNLDAALARIREYILPWEDAQVRPVVPTGSFVGKILMIEREWIAGRIEVVLVRRPVGV
ncbi:MAG: LUD domain-containing protein [Spirochaetia bacterium]